MKLDGLRIFEWNESDFSGNGLGVLAEQVNGEEVMAINVKVERELNGDWRLTFDYPLIGEKRHLITTNRLLLCEGQRYRINRAEPENTDKKTLTVTALHIFRDCEDQHIQYIGNHMGSTPRELMLLAFAKPPFHVMTDAEVESLGMSWVKEKTDLFAQSKTTPDVIAGIIIEQLGRGELYVDNYNVAIVEEIGRDNGVRLNMEKNLTGIKVSEDKTELITRLYPYGINDLHVGSVNGGKQFIDSPNIAKYGVKEGFADYNDIDSAADLLERARYEFDPANPQRIDEPVKTYEASIVDLAKIAKYGDVEKIGLGDTAELYDELTNVRKNALEGIKTRAIKIEHYPFEPANDVITLGQPRKDLWYYLKKLNKGNNDYEKTTDASGQVKTHWLEMMRQNETTAINNDLEKYKIAKFDYGAIWTNDDIPCAVAIINGKLCISNKRVGGDWYWTSIMDAGKVLVGEVFTGALYTDLVTILSSSGKLKIENNLITMRDNNNVLRAEIGLSGSAYVFNLYDASGAAMITLDGATGEATFAGNIDTAKSIKIGREVVMRLNGTDYGRIYAGNSLIPGYTENTLQMVAPNIDLFGNGNVLRLRGYNRVSIGTANNGVVTIDNWRALNEQDYYALQQWVSDNFMPKPPPPPPEA